jgi:hypothetical protein
VLVARLGRPRNLHRRTVINRGHDTGNRCALPSGKKRRRLLRVHAVEAT